MSSDISQEQFHKNLGTDKVLIQSGPGPNVLSMEVHRNLITVLDIPMLRTSANVLGEVFVLKKSSPEVLKHFRCWLYSTERNKNLAEVESLSLLMDIYKFARYYEIIDLGVDCVYQYQGFEPLFMLLKPRFNASDDVDKEIISDFIADLLREIGGIIDGADKQSPREVFTYMGYYVFGMKLQNPSLCNVMMDALQQHMSHTFLFSLLEIKNIFDRTDLCQWALIRVFCAALIHYQRHISDEDDPDYISDEEYNGYCWIPGFRRQYEEYEQAFQGFNTEGETSWDPRLLGGFDKCYFHYHTMKLEDGHIADYEGIGDLDRSEEEEEEEENEEEDESGSEDEEVGSRSVDADSQVIPFRPAAVGLPFVEGSSVAQGWHPALVARSSKKRKAGEDEEDEEDEGVRKKPKAS